MNILMISPFDLVTDRLWGPTIRLLSLARELNSSGHQVILAGPRPAKGETPQLIRDVTAHYFKRYFHRYTYLASDNIRQIKLHNRLYRLPFIMLSRFAEIVKLAKKRRIDVIYVNRACVDITWPAFLAHLVCRIPVVCDWDDLEGLHGFSTVESKPLSMQFFETLNECLFARLAAATVVASSYLQEFALRIGVERDRLFFAPTFADEEMFHPDFDGKKIRKELGLESKKVLFYCGNLSAGNGVRVENLLHTLERLLQKDDEFVLLVVGDGNLLHGSDGSSMLRSLAEALQLADKVIFAGEVAHHEVPSYLAAADLCLALFPVNIVTMCKSPLKVFEYMAAGKAVVARAVGEIARCIVDGYSGYLVYTDDPEEYAGKISACFADRDHLARVGCTARLAVEEKYRWQVSAASVEAACLRALPCAS